MRAVVVLVVFAVALAVVVGLTLREVRRGDGRPVPFRPGYDTRAPLP